MSTMQKDVRDRAVPPLQVDQVVAEFSRHGGIEAVAFELQRAFRRAGIDSRVVTSVSEDTSADIERIAPLVSRIGTRGRWRYVGRAMAVPLFTLAATRFLKSPPRGGRRVVLSHGDTLAGDVCVVHAVNRANIAAKREAGNWRWRLNPMHHWVSWRDKVMIGGLRFRRYVALSQRVVTELQHHYGVPRERIAVIPNGVNLERFSPAPDDRIATRRGLGVAADAPVLLFVGHEFERKGLVHAINALAALGQETRLVVVGAGRAAPFAQQAERLGLRGRVLFTGPRRDLPELYRAADAFVFPTAYEAFPLACMEAMACGLPVFACRVGGIEDYLRDGVNGHFIKADGAAIAAALAPVLSDPAKRERLRLGAVATAEAYAWPKIAEQYRRVLEDVQREIAAENPSRVARSPGLREETVQKD